MNDYGYELFYSSGGHGGPYWSITEALEAARRKLARMPSMLFISVVVRDPLSVGGYGRIVQKVTRGEHG